MNPEILIADDDSVISELLKEFLESENLSITLAADGQEALDSFRSSQYDLVVLDIMMPKLDGIEVLKAIRQENNVPVIMLTARGDDLDRILGLELGADDYVSKPCNPRELLARIKAVLRRISTTRNTNVSAHEPMIFGDLTIQPNSRQALSSHGEFELTATEFELLSLLVAAGGDLVDREKISESILDRKLGKWDRSIDVHVSNLRRKLEAFGAPPVHILTIRGSGYRLQEAADNS